MDDPDVVGREPPQENAVPGAVDEGNGGPLPAQGDEAGWRDAVPDVDGTAPAPEGLVEPGSGTADDTAGEASAEPAAEADVTPAVGETEAPEAGFAAEEAPETGSGAEQPAPAEPVPAPRRSPVPWWPYLAYVGCWAALAGGLVFVGMRTGSSYLPENSIYPALLLAGLTLAVCGPLLGLFAWLLARRRLEKGARTGLLTAAFLRASMFTLGGVALWWLAIVLVDALRLGWL